MPLGIAKTLPSLAEVINKEKHKEINQMIIKHSNITKSL